MQRSLTRSSARVYGPVPIGLCDSGRLKEGCTTKVQNSPQSSATDRTGFARLRRTVRLSCTSTPFFSGLRTALPLESLSPVYSVSAAKVDRPRLDEPKAGSDQRRMFQATCSAVTSSPLCPMTPLRTCSVQVLRSAEGFHDSINMGRTTLSGPTSVRYSKIGRTWLATSFQL